MFQNQIVSLLFLLLSFFSDPVAKKPKILTKKEVAKITAVAVDLMLEEKFEKSLIQSRLALKYAIAIKNENLIATNYNTIAGNFDGMAEFEKAFFYYQKGLFHANKGNNDQLKNWLYNNLANIYCFDKKEYKKGIYFYKKSLDFSEKSKDTSQILFTKLNITWAYFDIGHYNEGSPYLEFINKHHEKFGDESTIVALNMLNGMYYGNNNQPSKAITYFEKAIKLGNEGHEKSDLSYSHQEYSKFLITIGKYKKAYENLDLYNKITAELNNKEKIKKANIAGINLEIDEYKREIDNIETKFKTKEQLLLEKQSKNKQISIIIISLLLFIIILLYFFYQNIRLKQKNKLKDIQSDLHQNIINATINGQEIERKKIASFLHDHISALLSSAGLHLSVFTIQNERASEEIIKTKAILEEVHDKVRDLSHELLPTLLSKFGLFYALQDLLEKKSNTTIYFEYSSLIPTRKRYNEEFEMKIYFIITELLNNIIKHSQANKAKITINENGMVLQIHILDNGKGFDSKNNLLEGFGINQIRARINNMKGQFSIDSKINHGSSIYISVPIL